MASLHTGTVQKINLKDNDVNSILSVEVHTLGTSGGFVTAVPLDVNIKRIPLIGEQVLILQSQSPEGSGDKLAKKYYYLNPTSTQLNIHNNALPKSTILETSTNNRSYESTSVGNPISNASLGQPDLGEGFKVRNDVASLQPFLGDVLIEGRFAQSLRFGYTPRSSDTTKSPTWEAIEPSDPITILSNGRRIGGRYNKFTIEDVNNDQSSIWMTSSQRIKIKPSQRRLGGIGVIPQSRFTKPSIVLNSDRIFLNAKSDRIILSGGNGVSIASKNWATDMDTLVDQVDAIQTQVTQLTNVLTQFASALSALSAPPLTPVGATAAPLTSQLPTIISNLAQITAKLKAMKQQ